MIGTDGRTGDRAPAGRPQETHVRARELGIAIGHGRPGPANAITDVRGVRVGHATLIRGDGALVVGRGTGPDRRDDDRPPRWRHLDRAGLRRQPPPERQRRADGPRVDPRGRPPDGARRDHEHPFGRRRPRRDHPERRPEAAVRDLVLGAAGRRRDVGRPPERHRRVPRDGRPRRPGPGGRVRRGGRRGQRRRRDRDDLPRVQGRDRDGVAGRGRVGRRLHGRRARPGELRPAGAAAGRRRAGRRGDPGHGGPAPGSGRR